MKLLSFFLAILLAIPVFAQEQDIRDIKIDGKEFVAFDTPTAMKLLRMRMDYPKLELEIDRLKELVDLKDQELLLLGKIQTNHKDQIQILLERNADLQKQIYRNDAWWKSPWLWTAVGLAAGIGLTTGIAYSVK